MNQTNAREIAADFDDLIREPREGLEIEVKEWLDLSDADHKAMLAKEIIALANHGGGYLVIGFREGADGVFSAATPRPVDLAAWSQDSIQAVIARYVDPGIQCRVWHRAHPHTGEVYPIIAVPGGHRIPVRAKAGSPDGKRLVPHRIYIRRPGPSSEEPRTLEEWDRFFERIVQNRQAELLDAMRAIMAGILPKASHTEPTLPERLHTFAFDSVERWERLVAKIPDGSPPRFPNGYYDVALAIDGDFDRKSLSELRDIVRSAVRNHSGWPPFLTLLRDPFRPRPIDGSVECWVGPDIDGSYDKPAHHDFWRISPGGFLFTRRGYPEDGGYRNEPPGTTFDITTATRRLGETVLQGLYIAQRLNARDANLLCQARWTGLAGRHLVSHGNPNRWIAGRSTSAQEQYEASEAVALAGLPAALPDLVHAMLAPLYQLFDFFELRKQLVVEELRALQDGRF